jgi:20S proteasome alpha/beta subunit
MKRDTISVCGRVDRCDNADKVLPWEESMTLCIAALCEDRNTIVLAADKMIEQGFVEAELEIEKIARLHPDWWVMFSGTVPNVFDIIDRAEADLAKSEHHRTMDVVRILEECYKEKRLRLVEATHLTPRGWSMAQFQEYGREKFGDAYFQNLDMAIAAFAMDLELIVAGFDSTGKAQLFTLRHPGQADRQDIPGYIAIGKGMFGALYFMFYRGMSVGMSAAEALYHVCEAKNFGYQAGGIGEETDFVVARFGCEPIQLQQSTLPELEKLWTQFQPKPTEGLNEALGHHVNKPPPQTPAKLSALKAPPTPRTS